VHTGGAHFLMLDGAVRFISENIDHNNDYVASCPGVGSPSPLVNSTYERLLGIDDEQPVGEF